MAAGKRKDQVMQPDDSRPVQEAIEQPSVSHEVTFLLNPLPKSGGKQDDKDTKIEKLKDKKVKKDALYTFHSQQVYAETNSLQKGICHDLQMLHVAV